MGRISPGAGGWGRATLLADEQPRLSPDRPHPLGPRVVSPAGGAPRAPRAGAGRPRHAPHRRPRLPQLPPRRPDDPARGLCARPARPRGRRQSPGENQPPAGGTLVRSGRRADPVRGVARAQPAPRCGRCRPLGRAQRSAVLPRCVRAPGGLAEPGAGIRHPRRRAVARARRGAGTGARPVPLARARRPGSDRVAPVPRGLRDRRGAPGGCGAAGRGMAAGTRSAGRAGGVETRRGVRRRGSPRGAPGAAAPARPARGAGAGLRRAHLPAR